jgi:hypothetical protein
MFHHTLLERLVRDKRSYLLGPFVYCKENEVLRMNGLDKLECSITLCWKGLIGTNALAYWAHLYFAKKMKCCK